MVETADILIIGAGIVGCSLAYRSVVAGLILLVQALAHDAEQPEARVGTVAQRRQEDPRFQVHGRAQAQRQPGVEKFLQSSLLLFARSQLPLRAKLTDEQRLAGTRGMAIGQAESIADVGRATGVTAFALLVEMARDRVEVRLVVDHIDDTFHKILKNSIQHKCNKLKNY